MLVASTIGRFLNPSRVHRMGAASGYQLVPSSHGMDDESEHFFLESSSSHHNHHNISSVSRDIELTEMGQVTLRSFSSDRKDKDHQNPLVATVGSINNSNDIMTVSETFSSADSKTL